LNLPVAIIAGGLATRLLPITEKIPKSLVEVARRPFIVHQLASLQRAGVRRVVVLLGHLGELVEREIGDGGRFGLSVTYSYDGLQPRGTAGALKHALPLLGPAFFTLYGDSYLEIDYQAVETAFEQSGLRALMTVFRNEGRLDTSNVVFRDGKIVCYDKRASVPDMRYIDYGLSVMRRDVLAELPDNEPSDLASVFHRLAADGQLAGFEASTRFFEIGSRSGLEDTRAYLSQKEEGMSYAKRFLSEASKIIETLDTASIEKMATDLVALRARSGRLFILGVGGSAGNASHAVNDFRKIVGIEAYAPTDNVSELTARVNDDGWDTSFANWLKVSRLSQNDAILVFSVGGGDLERNVSPNLVRALELARETGSMILGIVGRNGGYTAKVADTVVIVPTVNPETVTPHSEAFQAVVWHLLVSHPALQAAAMKWESTR
jgi:D-sedoheptulose 7-phosphate isomerase